LKCQALGVDSNDRTAASIVHNLHSFPYPFEGPSFDEIYIDNVLEHLDNVMRVMEGAHRICKPDRIVKVIVSFF
jgi:ubiquinone/menaquinone biosynthesis C-methylase UbiE